MKIAADKAGLSHLKKDPILQTILSEKVIFEYGDGKDLFTAIVENIIGQQLSGGPAEIITKRFIKLFSPKKFPTPADILNMPDQKLRDVGMSWAKVKYIKCLSQAIADKTLDLKKVPNLSDEEVIIELTKVKGIGCWTAEMILIFHLHRPDVFSLGDLGLRTAVSKLYKIDRKDLKMIEEISQKWSPHRSLASRFLWRSLDND